VDPDDYLTAIRADAASLSEAARAAGLDAMVPSCPGWQVSRLLGHVGRVHRWCTLVVQQSPGREPDLMKETEHPPAGPEILPWFEAGADALVDALGTIDPDAPGWAWGADQHLRFWPRRMAHETAVHRWDAQLAAGSPQRIDGDLAVDGIDECFDNLAFRRSGSSPTGSGETIHLHCTDRLGEWLLRLTPEGVEITREHAKGDVAARATASDLELFLVGRLSPEAVEVFGDESLLERWQAEAKF
jgi:uncharacterized protein (TIGR03083 family)